MKRKNRLLYLKCKQQWWDRQPESFKHATTRPGSIKTK